MLDVSAFTKISEYEEVEKVVYLTRLGHRHRVEAVHSGRGKYRTIVYRELDVIVQPSEIKDGERLSPEHHTIWVRESAPWTDRQSADAAIAQLLSLWES